VRILLVDDHTLVRKGLAQLLACCMDDVEVLEAGDADQAEGLLRAQRFDVALVDIRLPGRTGLDLLRDIRTDVPGLPVIIVTNYDNPEYVRAAIAGGAAGYLLKDATTSDLSEAIAVAISGTGHVISGRAVRGLFDWAGDLRGDGVGRDGPLIERLTRRETDILELLAAGHGNRHIARTLFVSEKTVKAHLASVFRKLEVTNRTQAAMAAVSMGIGEIPGLIGPSTRGAA